MPTSKPGAVDTTVSTKTTTAVSSAVATGLVGAVAVFAFSFFWSSLFSYRNEASIPTAFAKAPVTADHRDLTAQLLQNAHQGKSSDQLSAIAEKRKTSLLKLVQTSPEELLVVALPNDVRQAMIDSGVDGSLLEERIDRVEGVYEVEHNNTFDQDGNMLSHNARSFLIQPDGREVTFAVPEYEIPVMHGSTLALANAVKFGNSVFASQENLTVVNEVLPGHTIKKVAGVVYKFQSDPETYAGINASLYSLDDRLRKPIFTDTLSTRKYYLENSFGQLVLNGKINAEQGDVFGEYTIPDSTSCSYSAIRTAVIAQASAAGVDLTGYDYYAMLGKDGGVCRLNGYSGNTYIAMNTKISAGNLAHEMGHMFGVIHVNSYPCMDPETTNRVPLSTNCRGLDGDTEYGGGFDVEGGVNAASQLGHMVEYHKVRLNWLPIANVQTVTTDGAYTIAPIEQLTTANPMAIRIPRKKSSNGTVTQWFSLQYHQPNGDFEGHFSATDPHFTGIMVHLNGGFHDVGMLDMEPESNLTGTYVDSSTGQTKYKALLDTGFSDYTLKLNKSFTDPVSGVSVNVTSLSASGATVQVTFGPGTCVRGNPGLTISPASQWGYAGQAKAYTLTLTNNDTSACAASTFNVANSIPADWTINPGTFSEPLAAGASVSRTVNLTSPATATDGFYTFSLTATSVGVPTSTASATATYVVQPPDTIPPTVSISNPSNGARLKGKNFKVQTSASDPSGVAKIEIFIDGVSKQVCTNVYSCSYSSTLSTLTTGSHVILATATDASPNANSASTSVTVTK